VDAAESFNQRLLGRMRQATADAQAPTVAGSPVARADVGRYLLEDDE
jgi:hypothetical protein